PLAPADWPYFAVDDVPYRGRRVSILWDKDGTQYGKGAGLHLLADGKVIASSPTLGKLSAPLPPAMPVEPAARLLNYAVNNDGGYYPKPVASVGNPQPVVDGNYWYHRDPPNRWTSDGSSAATDWCGVEFGVPRPVSEVKLYFLDDADGPVRTPAKFELEYRDGDAWKPVPGQQRRPTTPTGRRANVVTFPELKTTALRAVLTHRDGSRSGLTEFEAWGSGSLPVSPAPMPAGNLAHNPTGQGFPKATASYTFPRDRAERAIDGVINFRPEPTNRWTSYGSPNEQDWLAVDFGKPVTVGRLELGIYDDRGGVRPPTGYVVQVWTDNRWADVANPVYTPEKPAGGRFNEVRFVPVTATKVRVVFTHAGKTRSGVTEVLAFER
ncbi:MAG: discoidin domain-containing protein, partial [Gemmataceae bacterium]